MKRYLLIFIALCGTAVAQEKPNIMGSIPNKGNGQIIFTSVPCTKDTGNVVYIHDPSGKISLTGCWTLIDTNIFVKWSDGDIYSYPVGAINFTDAYNEWYNNKNKPSGQTYN